jgi:2'-5' RNA ligase
MRLFVALDIPEEVRQNLTQVRRRFETMHQKFQTPGVEIRWTPPENYHVTLKFIGEVKPAGTSNIINALSAVRAPAPLKVSFRELGLISNAKGFAIFMATIHPSDSLNTLAAEFDKCLIPFGVLPQDRKFIPHLTLARYKNRETGTRGVPPEILALRDQPAWNFGELNAAQFHLMNSILAPAGSKYTTVASFPLTVMART